MSTYLNLKSELFRPRKFGFFIFVLFYLSQNAWSNLQVFPTRILLTDQKKTAHLSMRFLGKKPEKYKIYAIFYRMKADGSLIRVETPTSLEKSAIGLLRFSPREVVLQPGVEQVLRILAVLKKPLEEGEYRAHILFDPVLEYKAAQPNPKPSDLVRMQLEAKVAVAVPVFYRHGNPQSQMKLSELKYIDLPAQKKGYSAFLTYHGSRFPHGDLLAYFTEPGKEPELVGVVAGISSYVPKRKLTYPFQVTKDKIKNGKLRLEFREPKDDGAALIDALEIEINKLQ